MSDFKYPDDLILHENQPKMTYDGSKTFTKNMHYGQVKLFSNELEFLLSFVFKNDRGKSDKRKIVLYIGAGPGEHIVYLAKMFPTVEWHLFDCRFDPRLEKNKNVYLELRYFRESDVKIFRDFAREPDIDLYLISDIRNLTYDSKSWSFEETMKSWEDMELQRSWVEQIKPVYSMLKFKLPFPEPEVLEKIGESVSYLPGIIYKQPWARGKSVETRLIISSENMVPVEWSLKDFEEQMFYHNAVIRQEEYNFPFSDELDGLVISRDLKLNKRYDTAYIVTLLYQYFLRVDPGIIQKPDKLKTRIIGILKHIGVRDHSIKYITANCD